MGTIHPKLLFREIISRILPDEQQEEREAIAYRIVEHQLGLSRTEILRNKAMPKTPGFDNKLDQILRRINSREPLQYVLEEAYFYGRRFSVSPEVLIPRPETEELITHVINSTKRFQAPRILDVGTGSGCIAITLALEHPQAVVMGTDVSTAALEVAQKNARSLTAWVECRHHDILTESIPGSWDIIVSNPPYVAASEEGTLDENVRRFEPRKALFVEDHDPLIFYRVIAEKSKGSLSRDGALFVEINESYGKETHSIFESAGYDTTCIKDINGKDRIVKGVLQGKK